MTLDGDEDADGTPGGEPEGDGADDEGAGADAGDGGDGAGGDGGGDPGDGGEPTPPKPKAKAKPKPPAAGDGDGDGGDDPITAGLAELGTKLESVLGEQGDALRKELTDLERRMSDRIELAERRAASGNGAGSGGGGAGGPGTAAKREKGLLSRLLW